MASLKDVLIITDKIELAAEKNKVDINAMFTRHTIWTAGIAFSVVGIMIALKFWP